MADDLSESFGSKSLKNYKIQIKKTKFNFKINFKFIFDSYFDHHSEQSNSFEGTDFQ